jgi:hypothetical protein
MYVCIYVWYVCMYVRTYVRMYACMYVYMSVDAGPGRRGLMCVCLVCDLPSEYRGGAGAASAREAGSGNRRVSSAHIHPTATPPLNIAGPMFPNLVRASFFPPDVRVI